MNPLMFGRPPAFAPIQPSPYGYGYPPPPQMGVYGAGGGHRGGLGNIIGATGALVTYAGVPTADLTAAPTAADHNTLKNAVKTGALIQAIGGFLDLIGGI